LILKPATSLKLHNNRAIMNKRKILHFRMILKSLIKKKLTAFQQQLV